jgi:Dyp-type peroxidase family
VVDGPTVRPSPPAVAAGLPTANADPRLLSLGADGSYLVVRQLAQDVAGFDEFLEGTDDPEGVGAAMVGRTKDGASLTAPLAAERNDFGYHDDQDGLGCPVGAHVRRAFPRDSSATNPGQALRSAQRHRILRRGRAYGPAVEPGATVADTTPRGLLFVCLNADIERQFEFVQHTWLNGRAFADPGEMDPLTATQPEGGGLFSRPARPVRKRYRDLPTFVTTKGGGYFFLPSLPALRYLADPSR